MLPIIIAAALRSRPFSQVNGLNIDNESVVRISRSTIPATAHRLFRIQFLTNADHLVKQRAVFNNKYCSLLYIFQITLSMFRDLNRSDR
jgi:hypothetical protein